MSVTKIKFYFVIASLKGIVLCLVFCATVLRVWCLCNTFSLTLCMQEFTTKGSSCNDTGNIVGSLETKYKQAKHGLTFTEKWTTDNNLSSEVAIEDQIATGLKLSLCTAFSPSTGYVWYSKLFANKGAAKVAQCPLKALKLNNEMICQCKEICFFTLFL